MKRTTGYNTASYFMANFSLKFRFLDSNNNFCKQKDLSSKNDIKVYTAVMPKSAPTKRSK